MAPLLHGVWAEVLTLVLGEVRSTRQKNGEVEIHTRNLSYFSRKVSAQEFQRLALVEFHRRGVERAQAVAAVMDGADWEQGFVDFPHAAEHLNAIGEYLYGGHTPESQAWLRKHSHRLKHEGAEGLLLELDKLQSKHPQTQFIASNLAYLKKRIQQMQYPLFQSQGWPIGSGIVESGYKLVVEARIKGAGMHWAEAHVNPMLAASQHHLFRSLAGRLAQDRNALTSTNPSASTPDVPQPSSQRSQNLGGTGTARQP